MVVVSLHPTLRFMEFSGMGTSTRKVAMELWGDDLPDQEPDNLMHELYTAENKEKPEPSGSQDMAGIIYPGISRLDYDYTYEGGTFPIHVESCNDPDVARWLEKVIYMLPVAQRPPGYSPLGEKNLDPEWIAKLSQSGRDCYQAIISRDVKALGASMNLCMTCWEKILPHTIRHSSLKVDLMAILQHYQNRYPGAMYSGCGGGYLYVVSTDPVPGAFQVKVRINQDNKNNMPRAYVTGSFDDMRSSDIRFLEEASKLGELTVFLWADKLVGSLTGVPPRFPQAERMYFLQAIRYVDQIHLVDQLADRDSLPRQVERVSATWVVTENTDSPHKREFSNSNGLKYHVVSQAPLKEFPNFLMDSLEQSSQKKKVIVTGCYDWFHSGHVRFFEEVSELGDLYVVAGSDENVRFLKGAGHPMFPQEERRYIVQSIRFVKQALISSGTGWMDAEPEIDQIKPDIYVVNEDGDVPDKRAFCEAHGILYVVLKRLPKDGLARRVSTDLRGF